MRLHRPPRPLLSVPQAAVALRVNTQRVHQLVRSGSLPAQRVGGRWAIEHDDVAALASSVRLTGRPYSPRVAWAALLLLSGIEPDWIGASEKARLRRGLAALDLPGLAFRVRDRATAHRLHAHPAALPRLLRDEMLLRTGASAEIRGLDLRSLDSASFYTTSGDLPAIRRRYGLVESGELNVTLLAVDGPWPFAAGKRDAPAAAVIVDLLGDSDQRSTRTAAKLYARIKPHALAALRA